MYLLGIDAGATKTVFALYDTETKETLLHYGGCGNHEGMEGGYVELREMMGNHIQRVCEAAGIRPEDIGAAGLGIAGVDTKRQHGIISGIFRDIGLSRFGLANDGVLGIKAECPAGICAVNGTGFSVYGIDDEGNTAQMGGLGCFTGDSGGGSYYAARGFEAVYKALEEEGPETMMTGETLKLLGTEDPGMLVEALSEKMESEEQSAFLKELSILVHRCAKAGDEAARRILRESGKEYAACVMGVVRHLPRLAESGKVELILVGSCFLKADCDLTRRTMEQVLAERLPDIQFHVRTIRTEPAAGGLLWAREIAGAGMEADEEIRASFSRAKQIS